MSRTAEDITQEIQRIQNELSALYAERNAIKAKTKPVITAHGDVKFKGNWSCSGEAGCGLESWVFNTPDEVWESALEHASVVHGMNTGFGVVVNDMTTEMPWG